MKIQFGQVIQPLSSKEKIFIFNKYFDPYYDLMQSVELFYKQGDETYYFICATGYIIKILDTLADLSLDKPCLLLINYLNNFRDLDFPDQENSIIQDKNNFIENIEIFIDNNEFYQDDWNKNDLISVCHYLIEFVKLSKENILIVQYG